MSAILWAVLGFLLILAELLLPAFVLIWFGLGALLLAASIYILPQLQLATQLLLWAVFSGGLTGLWFGYLQPRSFKSRAGLSDAEAISEIGLLISPVAPYQRGRVRCLTPLLGAEVWDCIADQSLPAGARVRVRKVEGSLLKVDGLES
jgi:membrane protein implicated in regulation of membrane protease activity